eukprot:NODE_9717_length_464_cov_3.845783_g8624_i0.p3 GENE.NODE_9717_length_464_cov_3.845783_g8624_i0~~NODE_9717_length_464_cov_3.845783_g8624_i0.p3  ORF type:complete len:53 (-),score=2.27 NODE_9717_length_464_cov_3.845783_g8624_i0:14-172(-)
MSERHLAFGQASQPRNFVPWLTFPGPSGLASGLLASWAPKVGFFLFCTKSTA